MIGAVLLACSVACVGIAPALAVRRGSVEVTAQRAGAIATGALGRTLRLPSTSGLLASRTAWMITSGAVGWLVLGPLAAPAIAAAAAFAYAIRRGRQERRRADAIDEQLADGVRAIAAGLRAGLSVSQSLRFAADEAEPPLAVGLRRVVDATDVGEPLAQAMHRWASEVGTNDARLVEGVLGLHRRTGGDLPRVLDGVARTLRERRAMSREVRALTAQARLSGAILGLLPAGFLAFLWLTSRDEIEGAFRTPLGLAAVGVGAVLEALAFLWIRRLLEVR